MLTDMTDQAISFVYAILSDNYECVFQGNRFLHYALPKYLARFKFNE